MTLPLSALEGFVLSRVDGRAPVSEIVALTGLPTEQVIGMLERLRELGALRWKGEPSAAPEGSGAAASAGEAAAQASGAPAASTQGAPAGAPVQDAHSDETPLYDPSELDEECDLPRERRKQVLDLFYRLDSLDYYEALELPYDADRKQIRAAYFALSKAFHPDTMFRKNLGSYKAKMEAVFKFLTEGYETLSKKKSREEYDAYLKATKATKMAERALAQTAREEVPTSEPVAVPPPPRVPAEIAAEATAPRESAGSEAPRRVPSAEARRLAQEVIARRLRGVSGVTAAVRVASSQPASSQGEASARPAGTTRTEPREVLRSLARTLKQVGDVTGTSASLERVVREARDAEARGDLSTATQLMRRALSIAPQDPEIKHSYERLSRELSAKLAEEYRVQAMFEAKQGKWAAAALAWSKVCEGRPQDAVAHRQAALALYKVGGDLRGAQKYAQQAVFLAPDDVDARLLLAQIYMTVGLKLNAKRELDAAAKLDPKNEIVKNLLSDLKG